MRGQVGWLGALAVLACTTPAPSPNATPNPTTQAGRTQQAIATTLAGSPPGVHTAFAAMATRPPTLGTPDYLDPRDLAAEPARFTGRALMLQGRADRVTQEGNRVGFYLHAQVRGRPTTETVAVVALRPEVPIRRDDCYRIEAVGAGTDHVDNRTPLVLVTLAAAAEAGERGVGCASP